MTSNRPFLSNFLAAFRAHSAIQKAATSSTTSTAAASSSSYSQNTSAAVNSSTASSHAVSSPRSISTKATQHGAGATSAAVQSAGQFQPSRQHPTPPYSRSPGSPGSSGFPLSTPSRDRRGSDSSSEGFREVIGAEKWYIGGRTATGEERFYKLGMVRRPRSIDRLSLDRLSI